MGRYGRMAWPALAVLTDRMLSAPRATALEALAAHGPQAADIHIPQIPRTELLCHITSDPGRYPSRWVWAAQEALARSSTEGLAPSPHPYLATVAKAEGWFTTE
ncbi:hypothetical protein ACWCQL_13770 [Streptomyces sp. NPDC002073]